MFPLITQRGTTALPADLPFSDLGSVAQAEIRSTSGIKLNLIELSFIVQRQIENLKAFRCRVPSAYL